MKHFSTVRMALIGAFAATAVVSCGSGSATEVDTSISDSAGADTTAQGESQTASRIVSLSPTHTEILFAIGAGGQVIAVDALSNHPPEAADVVTALSAFEANVESIVSYEPDLVVIGDDYNGLAQQLSQVGIDSWTSPAPQNIEEVLSQIEDLGDRIGRSQEARDLAGSMRADIDDIVEASPELPEALSYYHELDDSYFTVTSNTFIGSVYELFGLRNIADAAEANSDYPQLSAEFIISQDPALVFLADTKCCAVSAESVAARPGWDALSAVRSGHVIELDDDIASRWGPRVVELVRSISEAVAAIVETAS